MKVRLILFFVSCFFLAQGQELKGNIVNHENFNMDLVLMLFGMDNPISIGSVDKEGRFKVNLENVGLGHISAEDKPMYCGELSSSFYFKCNDIDAFGTNFDKLAAKQDFVRLTKNGEWAGTVFLVSDKSLKPWIEDPGYNDAILGSFYEIIYVEEDLSLNMNCKSNVFANENNEVEVEYNFDIRLKRGFNWVEYSIENVYKTNPDIRSSFPSKVTISNLKEPSKMLWIGTYY